MRRCSSRLHNSILTLASGRTPRRLRSPPFNVLSGSPPDSESPAGTSSQLYSTPVGYFHARWNTFQLAPVVSDNTFVTNTCHPTQRLCGRRDSSCFPLLQAMTPPIARPQGNGDNWTYLRSVYTSLCQLSTSNQPYPIPISSSSLPGTRGQLSLLPRPSSWPPLPDVYTGRYPTIPTINCSWSALLKLHDNEP